MRLCFVGPNDVGLEHVTALCNLATQIYELAVIIGTVGGVKVRSENMGAECAIKRSSDKPDLLHRDVEVFLEIDGSNSF